ncbi:asparagine--tRNA ligase [Erysipelothrix inopinata]|uniref:Asparagine--tRNA ligase n=1 Tax=Erysipelothrix inopinata TaxID=225084 RepID=A0A7G9RZ21_9FIRM|nr:asparagine--tRNA ligase [Erysipelothrix inopinata]QNN60846.1 asparagine--tRNA ligase [Erysipelothrix inopinata]
MMSYLTIRECYDLLAYGSEIEIDSLEYIQIQGWIRTNRKGKNVGFIELNDGTYFRNAQCVYSSELSNADDIAKYNTGTAVTISGKFKATPDGRQPFEIDVKDVVLEGECGADYPLQKKRHSYEYLRDIAHLRVKTNSFMAVFRVRSVLSMAIHEFFQDQGFVYVHTPIITGNDAEGAGESFNVTTRSDGDYEKDFFGQKASLTVSGQLHAEAFALAFRDVYTFGPTFRAENSNTARHASEFWMVEPEIAFADLEDDMNLIEDMVKYCIEYVLENAPEEMNFFNDRIDNTLLDRLNSLLSSEFKRLSYTDAIEILEKENDRFEYKVHWGVDLQSEHERYLSEEVFKGPVFITDYPKDIKAFYMRLNDDNKTVAACDLLVPQVGELVGGSQREERIDVLDQRMEEMNIPKESLEWYRQLREYGGVKHAGFGIGFERFLMYITAMQNIRDVIPFPRTPRHLDY